MRLIAALAVLSSLLVVGGCGKGTGSPLPRDTIPAPNLVGSITMKLEPPGMVVGSIPAECKLPSWVTTYKYSFQMRTPAGSKVFVAVSKARPFEELKWATKMEELRKGKVDKSLSIVVVSPWIGTLATAPAPGDMSVDSYALYQKGYELDISTTSKNGNAAAKKEASDVVSFVTHTISF